MWTLINRKSVRDFDGFMTEYSWYFDGITHVFVFGDPDIYCPEDGDWDWETESEEEAEMWFDDYRGADEEDAYQWLEHLESVEEDYLSYSLAM